MRKQKLLAVLLALVMVATLVPITAAAMEKEVTSWKPIESLEDLAEGEECAIIYLGPSVSDRVLYHASGATTTDQLVASISDNVLDMSATLKGQFEQNTIVWRIAPTGDGKYTIQSTSDNTMYLDLTDITDGTGSGKAKVSSEVKALTIEANGDGAYTISADQGDGSVHYLSHGDDNNFFYTGSNNDTTFVIYTEVTEIIEVPDPTLAPNHYGAKGVTQPTDKTSVNSDYFYISGLITLDNGWQVVVSDIRWRLGNDNPNNMDTIVSVSKDNGKTWDWETLNYVGDYSINNGSTLSASFIDPAIMQAESGNIWMAVDLTPFMYNGTRGSLSNSGTGYEGDTNIMLVADVGDSPDTTVQTPTDPSLYAYRVDLSGEHGTETAVDLWGDGHTVYPIYPASGNGDTGMYVDAFFNLYERGDDGLVPVQCEQYGLVDENYYTQNNILYAQSKYRLFPTFYFCLRKGVVDGDGIKWEEPIYPNVRNEGQNQYFYAVCPGRGTSVKLQNGGERVMFQMYDNNTGGTEYTSTFYSDDGGETWQRGQYANNMGDSGATKSSESQIIYLPDGNLRMYSRNTGTQYITYADSEDGGVTWSAYRADTELSYVGNCMVSFINVEGTLIDPKGDEYTNLIMGSYPKDSGRQNGTVRVGYIDDDNVVNWFPEQGFDSELTGHFQYSCLTQAKNSDGVGIDLFGLLYNPDDSSARLDCRYKSLNIADVLGDGYYIKPVAPTAEDVAEAIGNVTVTDTNTSNNHGSRQYPATADSITVDTQEPTMNDESGKYEVTAQLSKESYLNLFNNSNSGHTLVDDANIRFTLAYDTETGTWSVQDGTEFVVNVVCQTPVIPPAGGSTAVPEDNTPLAPAPDDDGADIPDDSTPLAPAPDGDTDISDTDTPLDSTPKTGDTSIEIAVLWSIFSLSAVSFAAVMLSMKKSGKHTK